MFAASKSLNKKGGHPTRDLKFVWDKVVFCCSLGTIFGSKTAATPAVIDPRATRSAKHNRCGLPDFKLDAFVQGLEVPKSKVC